MNLTKLCKPQMVLYTSMCLLSKSFVNTSITCKELHNRVSKKIVEETIVKTLQKGMRLKNSCSSNHSKNTPEGMNFENSS